MRYKQLWTVEEIFRSTKSLLETRPVYHKCGETIRGHVFCSFLAPILRNELQDCLAAKGERLQWADVIRDLEGLQGVEVHYQNKRFVLRSETRGTCGKGFQAGRVALPSTMRQGDI